ncbi:H(+)/Cl(-) exchange transporter 5-like protein 2 [Colletotrichum plurivorum]|uniref:H(+)/Cl(-) exchange transporter 5-like protein 2 n=1 Tax=Colletotrichum plurivorum TaxID=2175906 RepID=A0A8H6NG46_9PEZI|nr:H(+)/Cl(-) exchange transporter 5-like protein 2 [Colletotrichum plurivorum]
MAVTTEPRAATDRPVQSSGPMAHCRMAANLAVTVFKLTGEVVLEAERGAELIDVTVGGTVKLVDRKPVTVSAEAPMEYVLELFGQVASGSLLA